MHTHTQWQSQDFGNLRDGRHLSRLFGDYQVRKKRDCRRYIISWSEVQPSLHIAGPGQGRLADCGHCHSPFTVHQLVRPPPDWLDRTYTTMLRIGLTL